MSKELALVLVNPYTIGKSRTGGVLGRYLRLTGLSLAAVRMFGPSMDLTRRFADLLRADQEADPRQREILAEYVMRAYAPDPETGRRQRVMMLLFEGEDAIAKIRDATGNVRDNMDSGRTVRDIYGDYIMDREGRVLYVEPAVMIGPTHKATQATLKLWAGYSNQDGGIIDQAGDVPREGPLQKTLVLIKPDNFRFPSSRPGNIIDIFSGSGLRIIGAKLHRMSVSEALEFYGPVRSALLKKLSGVVGKRARETLTRELGFDVPEDLQDPLGTVLGPAYADQQFYELVQFMTGHWAPQVPEEQRGHPGWASCLALVYAGLNAVDIIRGILGPTDPSKADPGSVRREYGHNIMINAAHASDSAENAEREMRIVRVEEDQLASLAATYYPDA